jgi:aspartyl-tRNA(Asn)/glutamyl-tRNA(Gln) amidotransferase subunit C
MSENTQTKTGVDVTEVRRVAELANLELTQFEETAMQRDLNAILDHIAQLNELDTSNVAPMAQVSEVLDKSGQQAVSALREDVLRPSLDRKPVMEQAPETDGIFFKVPKVIER